MEFQVIWEIDAVDVNSPREAAAKAWKAMRRKGSIATVFTVVESTAPARRWIVDLTERTVELDTGPLNPSA